MQDKDEIEIQRAKLAMIAVAQSTRHLTAVNAKKATALVGIDLARLGTPPTNTAASVFRLANLAEQRRAYQAVSEARTVAIEFKKRPVAASTESGYTNKANHMLKGSIGVVEISNPELWKQALESYAGKSNSFRANRAAACWLLRQRICELLTKQDRHQKIHGQNVEWLLQCEQIQRLFNALQVIRGWSQEDVCAAMGNKRTPKKSKSKDLVKIAKKYPDWQSRMREELLGSKFADALLVLERMGCRPSELVAGVEISLSQPGWFSLKVRSGSKVTKDAGQEWRMIHLPIASMPEIWRSNLANHSSYLVQIASADELRNKLQRASKKALPGAPYATAYVYRHAFATRLRDSGFKAEDIAAAMGHSVAHTQAKYGIRGGGKRKPKVDLTTIARFEVPRKVKPLDRSGLDFILAKKKASKKFKAP